ncbi:hypothetical protein GCM10010112_13600 [Actinoplanes lobatus]|uniref:Uncharacterized protein n=1 Tax=Actinoplanes lobatus TaxID=113568 RepID=A0A7W7MKB0_9ACTN|nr:hypothetical protein [Actinoplanes lobatus]MBB4753196.1 hypothetical protein [Actinoplanes lobatus]GGN59085.1 hypothetical protein GCM10010112_13600 [Actinoplanes lobatus]GIE42943.1 hypothetical protein Alo02nite_58410 [Actinoplanes lobatus]
MVLNLHGWRIPALTHIRHRQDEPATGCGGRVSKTPPVARPGARLRIAHNDDTLMINLWSPPEGVLLMSEPVCASRRSEVMFESERF